MSLPQIRADWAQHMIYGGWVGATGAAAVLVLAAVAGRPGLSLLAPAACLLTAMAAGVAKELWDAILILRNHEDRPHQVSAADLVATVTGAFPVAIPLFLMMWR